jgi:hypothetical protein
MTGYIKLYRQLLDNPIICKDTEHLAVWIYLLLNATHTSMDKLFCGKRVTLQPGQLITGRKAIAEKLNISESKVQRILKTFEIEQQIEQQTATKNRLITVKNWCAYQESEQQIEQQVNNNRTTSEQQVNTNKNVKNDKNVENVKKDINKSAPQGKSDIPTDVYDGRSFSLAMKAKLDEWLTYKKERRDSYKPTGLKAFLTQVENKLKVYTESAVIALIDECMASNWKGIIWDKLKNKASPNQGKANSNPFFEEAQRLRGDAS